MPKDPTIAVRDCLVEIAILHEIVAGTCRIFGVIRSFAAQLLESEDLARRAASLRGVKRLRS